jgi:putative DNA primase/helicase
MRIEKAVDVNNGSTTTNEQVNYNSNKNNFQQNSIDADAIRAEFESFSAATAQTAETEDDGFVSEDVEDFLANAPLTDTGNAECFAAEFGNLYRHNKTNDTWLRWNGVIWEADKAGQIDDDILSSIRHRQIVTLHAGNVQHTEKAKNLNYLIRCEDVRGRKNVKQAAQWLPKFATHIDQYDSKEYLASTLNGTIDLRDGKFYEAKRSDYITLQLGANYDPTATCPRWEQFLKEIFDGDDDLIRFMQKVVGYSLTGEMSEQKMFIAFGFGKNGKSEFVNVIQALSGDYGARASFKTFDADKQSEQTNDIAALKGKRFVSMIETGGDKKLNEPLVKEITGGDEITCRFLHREFFSYFPQFKLFLATNHKPVITHSDFAIWRRIVLIPFTQNFEGREEKGLKQKLMSELSGVLNWALDGLKLWQSEGLKPLPKAVTEATEKYKKDSDSIGQWLELRATPKTGASVQSSVAYNDYKDWTTENGLYPLGNRAFKASLEERGFFTARKIEAVFWFGFELKSRF